MPSDKIMRIVTFHLYRDKEHVSTSKSGLYKYNQVTGERAVDPFKACKTLNAVRQVFLTDRKDYLTSLFNEGEKYDFLLAKINKRGLSTFQQIFPYELSTSIKFIKDEI